MITRKKNMFLGICVILVVSVSTFGELVKIINVDFNVTGTNTMSGAAAVGEAGDVWNGVVCGDNMASFSTFTTGTLVDSENNASGLTLTVSAATCRYFSSINRTPVNLMYDYIGTAWPVKTVTINNVTPGKHYTLYLYGAGLNESGGVVQQHSRFIVDGVAKETSGTTQTSGLEEGQDYVVFTVTPADSTIVIGYGYDSYNSKGAVFNGLQIVEHNYAHYGEWLLDDPSNATVAHDTLGTEDAQLVNTPVFLGNLGKVRLDDTGDALKIAASDFATTESFSMSMEFCFTGVRHDDGDRVCFFRRNNGGLRLSARQDPENSGVYNVIELYLEDTNSNSVLLTFEDVDQLNDGIMHQISALIDRYCGVAYVYLEGQLIGSGDISNVTGALSTADDDLYFGGWGSETVPQDICFVRLWNGLVDLSRMKTVSVMSYGATGNGVTDDTAAIQQALDSGAATIYIPLGTYAIKSTTTALTLSSDDTYVVGGGALVPIANENGLAPECCLLVSGDRNIIDVEIANANDLGKQTSDASHEYPMDGIRVTGSYNTVRNCGIWNIVTPIKITGYSEHNRVFYNSVTAKSVDNLAWPNDGILLFCTNYGEVIENAVGMAVSAEQREVQLTDVSGASTSYLRCGITLDAYTGHALVSNNDVGEGFVVGIHAEGTSNEYNTLSGNEIKIQNRNGITAAGQYMSICGNACRGTFNLGVSYLSGIISGAKSNATIEDNVLECDNSAVEGIRIGTNAENITIDGNQFNGSFLYCVRGVANEVIISYNTLDGSAEGFALLDRPVSVSSGASYEIYGNTADGCTKFFSKGGSGHVGEVSGNEIYMIEGYNGTTGIIEFGGSYAAIPEYTCVINASDNTCSYVGSTPISGSSRGFVRSSVSGIVPSNLSGSICDNMFTTSIWGYSLCGTWLNSFSWTISGNSSNSILN